MRGRYSDDSDYEHFYLPICVSYSDEYDSDEYNDSEDDSDEYDSDDSHDSEDDSSYDSDMHCEGEYEEYYSEDDYEEESNDEFGVFCYSAQVVEQLVVDSRTTKNKSQRGGTSKKSESCATKGGRSKTSVKVKPLKKKITKPLKKKISNKKCRCASQRGSSSCGKKPAAAVRGGNGQRGSSSCREKPAAAARGGKSQRGSTSSCSKKPAAAARGGKGPRGSSSCRKKPAAAARGGKCQKGSSSCRKKPAVAARGGKGKGKAANVKRAIGNKKNEDLAAFLVFDLETTGLSRRYERIIEIALVDLVHHDSEHSTFHSLVNPGRPVTNSDIHGITSCMVNQPGVPSMHELIPRLLKFVKSQQKKPRGCVVLVAHNARCFDVTFLVNEFHRCSKRIPSNWRFLDTLPLAREAMKSTGHEVKGRVSLQVLREHYRIDLVGSAHSALSDVRSLSEVLKGIAFDLNLSTADLVQNTFRVKDLIAPK